MNILIVDDDRTNILVLSSILKQEGYTVLNASNGLEAINCFNNNHVDMILMDILMPEMDGYQAAKEIKSKTDERFVPIIFLTALTDENALAKCVENGGDDFLTKPYNRIILRSKIEALTRIRSLYNTLHKQKNELKKLNEKIESDVELANHVYKSLVRTNTLPKDIFRTWIAPVSSFNGDIALVMQTQSGGYHVMLGDFTGHGMAAALGTIPVCDLFQDMTQRGYKILDIIIKINQKLKQLLPTGYFCAASFLSIDNTGSVISIFNAGMPKVMIKKSREIKYINSSHLPLGIVELQSDNIVFDTYNLTEDYKVCIYSDGLVECKNSSGELYGYERLKKIIKNSRNITDDIQTDIKNFTNMEEQEDDISFVEISLPIKGVHQEINDVQKRHYDWSQSYIFEASALKNIEPVLIVIDGILTNNFPLKHKDRIYTIITELFNNSLEHGILSLDSKWKSTPEGFSEYYEQRQKRLSNLEVAKISIKVVNTNSVHGGKLEIELHDSGSGFDYESIASGVQDSNIFSGRGIMLVKSICEKLQYSDSGKKVIAEYTWEND
ncbi:MAG: fused response regulator/phosphatase [Asgard group archaeon]|nr:fused response regulator/phosphatase [Asgard group archaeon]